jgi:segregation and condensation protein A
MSDAELGYKVELDVFEGPLDLLLHLVKKHELDVLDIPIAFITKKYLEYLDLMKALNLDVAGEYLLMAATLAHIKSRELLPSTDAGQADDEGEEEEGDPRAELIRRLLQYQKYKEAAAHLGDRPVVGRNIWTRGLPQEESISDDIDPDGLAPLAEVPVIKLIEALDRVLARAKIKLTHEVLVDRLSVSDRINEIADRLERETSISFSSCFSFLEGDGAPLAEVRHEAVVTFLSVLEMAKLRLIRLSQQGVDEEIYITRAAENLRARVSETVVSEDEYR